jgi:gas vesicle protein
MSRQEISLPGALVGAVAGFVTEVTLQELTGHHFTHGVLELVGAAAGLWRLDRRLYESLQDTLRKAQAQEPQDYRQIKNRITELTQDLPELQEILNRMVDAGIEAQKA